MNSIAAPISPGKILFEEFLLPLAISQNQLAHATGVPVSYVADIIKGDRAITAEIASRFAAYFGTTPQMWQRLQDNYDVRQSRFSTMSPRNVRS